MAVAIESFGSLQLADWLGNQLRQRKIELKESERQTLIEEEINGSAFVLLSDEDLKDLGFKLGARKVISEIISSSPVVQVEVNQPAVKQGNVEADWDEPKGGWNHEPKVEIPRHNAKQKSGKIVADFDEPTVEVLNPKVVDNKDIRRTVPERTVPRPSSPPLEMRNSFDISQVLKNLTDDDIIQLGKALGLNGVKLSRKRCLPSDMVDCWLRQEDDVIATSGDPTRSSLADGLEKIGHKGTADKVRELQIFGRVTRTNGYHQAPVVKQAPSRSPGLAGRPTISQLAMFPGTRLKVIETISPKWKKFGLLLDFDEEAITLDIIEIDKRTPFDCCTEMFKRWLKGEGSVPATWDQLISLLEDSGYQHLAGDLERALGG